MSQQMSLAHLYSQMILATQTSNGLMAAADKAKLDTISGNYLSLSGGTVNGNLTIASGSIITADTFKGNLQGNADTATNVNWSGVLSKPTTLTGYGITDAVNASQVVTSPAANKILVLDSNGNLPASITGNATTATTASTANNVNWINVSNKPSSISGYGITDAVNSSEIVNVASAGKVLRLDSNGKLPTDITGNAATATIATSANSVAFNNVTGKPTTIAGYGITDAVNSSMLSTSAVANKVLILDANGKLPADITGNAATATSAQNATNASAAPWSGITGKPNTLAGYGITDAALTTHNHNGVYANSTHTHAATDITQTATSRFVTDVEKSAWNAKQAALGYTAENVANKGMANGYAGLGADGKIPLSQIPDTARQQVYVVANVAARNVLTGLISGDQCYVTGTGDSYIYDGTAWLLMADADWANINLDWSNVDGKPTTLAGYGITDAAAATHNHNGVYATVAHTHGNAEIVDVAWSKVTSKPTTISGYGITDAVNSSDVVTTATANKILKLNASSQLPASITGNSATATKLATARTITLGGDASGSVSFDGSVNVTLTATVANAASASAVAWAGVTDKPTTIDGYGITDAALSTHTHTGVYAAATHTHANADLTGIAWSKVSSKPTTVSGYGITDALTTAGGTATAKISVTASATGGLLYARQTGSSYSDSSNAAIIADTDNTIGTANHLFEGRLAGVRKFSVRADGRIDATDIYVGGTQVALSDHSHTSITGNAATATKLATARTITMSGNVTGSVSFDGSANATITTTVAAAPWSAITSKPTTLAGYGITDAALSSHTHSNYLATTGGTISGNLTVTGTITGSVSSATTATTAGTATTANNIPTSDVGGNIWVATAAGTEGITSNVVFGVSTAPASPQTNQIWFDSVNRVVKMWTGSAWVTFL